MKTVLHVYKDVYPPVHGGIEHHIDDLRRHVPGWRGDVLVCARSRETTISERSAGLEVRCGEWGRVLSNPLAPGLVGWIRRLRHDVLHLHMPHPTGEVAALIAGGRAPSVVTYHADIVRQRTLLPVYQPLARRVLTRASQIVVSSWRLAESSPMLTGLGDRLTVIPFGIDLDRFAPGSADPTLVQGYRERFPGPVILGVGRMVYYKDFKLLLKAAEGLKADVVLAGDGPLRQELESLAGARVHVLGAVSPEELVALYECADIFCLPSASRAESLGVATLEAQACGVPAVVADAGSGTVEAIENGRTGLLVPAGDAGALHAALARLLGDEALRKSMAAAAAARMRGRSLQSMGAAYADLYEAAAG
jgi:glycosyltransferase involved in cell wall biosynthesis